MLFVHFELYVQLDERRAGSVLEVNDARVDDFNRLEGSEVRGLPRQREVGGELGRRDGRGRRTFREFPLTSAEGFAVGHEPWEPEQFPAIGEHYADATLARASFSEWFNDLREW